jgi:flagellar assembly factor FliW
MTNNTNKRNITTSQFGDLSIENRHIFNFEEGMLGFEELHEFVLISEEETVPFKWLICIEKPEIGFPCLSPWHIDLTFDPGKDFDLEKEVLLVVITLANDKGRMTANMKAPIVLDVNNQTGKQVILHSDKYSPSYEITKK